MSRKYNKKTPMLLSYPDSDNQTYTLLDTSIAQFLNKHHVTAPDTVQAGMLSNPDHAVFYSSLFDLYTEECYPQ